MSLFDFWGKNKVTDNDAGETNQQAEEALETEKTRRQQFADSLKVENYSGEAVDMNRKSEKTGESDSDTDEAESDKAGNERMPERENSKDDDDKVR